jgi:hypothetical protein
MRVVVFLQNAWSPVFAGSNWPRASWLHALEQSRSGQRLKLLVDDLDLCENTTPIVGDHPDSVVPPDEAHIVKILASRQPDVVVACGRQAEWVLSRLWPGRLLALPHPAHRLVTNELYLEARRMLSNGLSGRVALRQRIGRVDVERIQKRN